MSPSELRTNTNFYTLTAVEIGEHRAEFHDLRARGLAEGARRQIATGSGLHSITLPLAWQQAEAGSGDSELALFLDETIAMALEAEGQAAEAVATLSLTIERLMSCPVVDRAAETMADLADLLLRRQLGTPTAAWLYEAAEARLEGLAPHLNRRLRRRLAIARRVN